MEDRTDRDHDHDEERPSQQGPEDQGERPEEQSEEAGGEQQGPPPPPPQGQQAYYYQPMQQIPNSTAVLVLGIISIVGCFCYGLPGLICGIIALVLSNKGFQAYNENPSIYSTASYNNLNAGRICAIIGVSLSALYFLWAILMLVIYGSALWSVSSAEPWSQFQ